MRLWIDEDLSPSLVDVAHAHGLDATCNRDRGLLGSSDREVLRRCIDEDRTLVTNNLGDFRRLCETRAAHPGLIVIPTLARAAQQELCPLAPAGRPEGTYTSRRRQRSNWNSPWQATPLKQSSRAQS